MFDFRENGEKLIHALTAAIIVAVFVGGIFYVMPEYARTQELKRQSARLSREIESRNRSIAKLKDNQRRFHSDYDFVERIARQNNKVHPGELVFIFEKN